MNGSSPAIAGQGGPSMPLHDLPRGRTATIVGIDGDDGLAHRLQASGLWCGAAIERLAAAPFGDPLLFRVHGFRLALRRSEAARVRVQEANA